MLILAIGLGACSLGHKVFPNFNKSALKEGYVTCNIDNFNKSIETILNGDKTLVYYFDGDCSICISKLLEYENIKVEGLSKIYVSQPADTMLLNFYTDKFAINAPVLVDDKSIFYDTNKELLDLGKQWF